MTITAHVLIKNDENFVWYSIMSVINYVDEILVWDTGSSDSTIEIIKSINSSKLKYKKLGKLSPKGHSDARMQMIRETKSDWIFILDGDEIWHNKSINNIIKLIKNVDENVKVIATPNYMLIGDIYHYQEEIAGNYQIKDKKGHYNIRAIKNILGLSVSGIYPREAYTNNKGLKVQNYSNDEIIFSDDKYLHASFLLRSTMKKDKLKHEIGIEVPKDYFYPEVFFIERPEIIKSPWKTMSFFYMLKSLIITPFKKIRRRYLMKGVPHGY